MAGSKHGKSQTRGAAGAGLFAAVALVCCSGSLGAPVPDGGGDGGEGSDGGGSCAGVTCPPGQYCVAGVCQSSNPCEGVVCPNPGETCDVRTGTCVSGGADDDGDGVTISEGDCDDGDPSIHPGATERCDGRDDDCDLAVDEGFDVDGDGVTSCGGDCDDSEAATHPDAEEICDGEDNDCDGEADEGIDPRPCTTDCGTGEEQCLEGHWSCSVPDACECVPGESQSRGCGNCGDQSRSCSATYSWAAWSACSGEGVCASGATRSCSECSVTGTQTCRSDCTWGGCVISGCCSDSECAADERCFSGHCSGFCHRTDGSQTCATVCGWAGMTCRGAIVYDTGARSDCGVIGVRMDCYGT